MPTFRPAHLNSIDWILCKQNGVCKTDLTKGHTVNDESNTTKLQVQDTNLFKDVAEESLLP